MLASQHYMRLATALASAFIVYVVDRRGRRLSGPHGDQYGMTKECEDVSPHSVLTGYWSRKWTAALKTSLGCAQTSCCWAARKVRRFCVTFSMLSTTRCHMSSGSSIPTSIIV